MKLFLFKPTNQLIAKIASDGIEDVPRAITRFLSTHEPVPLGSYAEASGRAWTITGLNPLEIRNGKVSVHDNCEDKLPSNAIPSSKQPVAPVFAGILFIAFGLLGIPAGLIVTAVCITAAIFSFRGKPRAARACGIIVLVLAGSIALYNLTVPGYGEFSLHLALGTGGLTFLGTLWAIWNLRDRLPHVLTPNDRGGGGATPHGQPKMPPSSSGSQRDLPSEARRSLLEACPNCGADVLFTTDVCPRCLKARQKS